MIASRNARSQPGQEQMAPSPGEIERGGAPDRAAPYQRLHHTLVKGPSGWAATGHCFINEMSRKVRDHETSAAYVVPSKYLTYLGDSTYREVSNALFSMSKSRLARPLLCVQRGPCVSGSGVPSGHM